jgi:hypothetical protein
MTLLSRHALSVVFSLALAGRIQAQSAGADTVESRTHLAQSAAARWLALVDSARYRASWDSAAAMFRAQVSAADWQQAVIAARSEVDPLAGRRIGSAEYSRNLPDAPPGEYVVIQYSTRARDGLRVVETVTLTLERKGTWRVVGYFIRPE